MKHHNSMWKKIAALEPGQQLEAKPQSPNQVASWRVYVSYKINSGRAARVSVQYNAKTGVVTFACRSAVSAFSALSQPSSAALAKVLAGEVIDGRVANVLISELEYVIEKVQSAQQESYLDEEID